MYGFCFLKNSPLSRAETCDGQQPHTRRILLTRREGHTPGHAPFAQRALCPKRRAAPRPAAPAPLPPPPPPLPTLSVFAAAAGQQTEKRQGQRAVAAPDGFGRIRAGLGGSGRVQADLGGSRAPQPCPTTLAAAAAARAAAARVTRAAVCRRACAVAAAEVESATCRLNEQRQAAGSSNPAWPSPSNPGQPWTWPQPSP